MRIHPFSAHDNVPCTKDKKLNTFITLIIKATDSEHVNIFPWFFYPKPEKIFPDSS